MAPEVVLQILSGGFNERLAKAGLFGSGIYFAEDVGKIDQYVGPDRDYIKEKRGENDSLYDLHRLLYPAEESHPQDVFYVLLCRVMLGIFARTKDGQWRPPDTASRTSRPLWRSRDQEDRRSRERARELADIP